ncbi:MAG: type I DNA topoisomerase [Candidatus Cloacimonetes bacterium]|jgi:DNA topoisomerase-1|nr:type I DNA topoisomerase [Candidatus Cloacimonadota bacterium]
MGKKLIIVESPAKAKTIGKFLQNKFIIKASNGHIRDLPKRNFGVDPSDDFKAKYVVDPAKKKIIKELKLAAKEADSIYLASDHDREGEAIAWHLTEVLKKEIKDKDVHRIIFNEITKTAITEAVKNPGELDINKVNSQQARRILDRIVGYNVSPVLWKIVTKNLSAGRVQSVALRIICEREEVISKFEPVESWNVYAILFKDKLPEFKATLKKWKDKKPNFKTEVEAKVLLDTIKTDKYIIESIKKAIRTINPGPPYITSTLQQDAARILNFSAKKTMMVAQQLYEGIELSQGSVGLITYMRTDSLRVSQEAITNSRKLISERYGEKSLNPKPRYFKNKNSAQDAHEAIRTTNCSNTPESIKSYLTKDQLNLYTIIWQKFIATQMLPVKMNNKELVITIGDATFSANGSSIENKGFLVAFPHTKVILGEKIDNGYVKDDILKSKETSSKQSFTKPPSRYTEALLIKELESKGIGRPSTYAAITNTIRSRNYVILKAKRFHPTELGLTVNKLLVASFHEFFNVEFTAAMEDSLDKVMYGEVEWHNLLKQYYESLNVLISEVDFKEAKKSAIEETDLKCEKCGSMMVIKWGRNGQFLACSNFPECKNIKNFTRNENGVVEILKPKTLDKKCPKCESDLILKEGKFGKFIACSNFPKCKHTEPYTIGIKCPDCEDGQITEKKNSKGRFFYSCSNYPDCKFITNNKPVAISCPECGNHYLEEKKTKDKGEFKECPKCKNVVY